ncbi:two-component system, response regulator YesN [Gracilibacillus ureilyticus]|uniref:Two-component system, response regulator YesN n=1 Tax=Gracilibacillus ureilyticus TaxID=531814 RepID=A0A1H9R8V8_9BACI|nr:response regulator [Gracilibacillus ureilyticus]SER69172.1 two-component system, response regulator YesN [Gracilibacillus ureilyticus]
MKKVFLVDDEAVIRRGIAQKIDWENEGFIYCGDASDGEMALPLIERHQPDIVITDIKMPFMDGLTLAGRLKESMPHIKIIILSGHDEFEYAQQAIRIQVEEYCLKPVSSQDLVNILRKVKAEMDTKRTEFKNMETNEELYEQLCKGALSTEEINHQAKSLQVDLIAGYYTVLVIEKNNEPLHQHITSCQPLLFAKDTKWVLILKNDIEQMLLEQIDKIKQLLTSHHPSLLYGLGSIETRTEHITVSYENALEAYNYSRAIQSYTFLQDDQDVHRELMQSFDRRKLIHFLKFGQQSQLDAFIQSYASFIYQRDLSNIFLYYFLLDFTITLRHHLEESEYDERCKEIIEPLEKSLHQIRTKEEMIELMKEMLRPLLIHHEHQFSKHGNVIQQVKQIVTARYHDSSLSLQEIAKEVNISASYLSNIFSKELNQTITEFLTKTRMEQAKHLLQTTSDKTYEIAYKVGFNDSHYFCHTFKKVTGMTTKEYRNYAAETLSATSFT